MAHAYPVHRNHPIVNRYHGVAGLQRFSTVFASEKRQLVQMILQDPTGTTNNASYHSPEWGIYSYGN